LTGSIEKLANAMVIEFDRTAVPGKIDWLKTVGFTDHNLKDPNVLFDFLATLSYDMQPFRYSEVWGTQENATLQRQSVRDCLRKLGIALHSVETANEEELRIKLGSLKVHGRTLDKIWQVDHAKGLIELAKSARTLSKSLNSLGTTKKVLLLWQRIDDVRGFGPTLSAKAILFLVRCLSDSWKNLDPQEMRLIAEKLLGEKWVGERAETIRSRGVDQHQLFDEMTRLGDPFAIEVLYELEDSSELERLLNNAGY
jgi:hypothetical protein